MNERKAILISTNQDSWKKITGIDEIIALDLFKN